MNELALFAGAGGGILGGHLLGWRTVCAVEWDAYAIAVLCARQNDGVLPPFPIWDDIRSFDGRPWRGRVDVVSGGFPCQDISSAGKGAGITGARSGLWSEMARIVGEVRPRYVFVENSPNLVGRGLARVLGDLASMGYDARWGVLAAADAIWSAGRPCVDHLRNRMWIVATANADGAACGSPASAYAKGIGHGQGGEPRNVREAERGQNRRLHGIACGASCESSDAMCDGRDEWRAEREGQQGRAALDGAGGEAADTQKPGRQGAITAWDSCPGGRAPEHGQGRRDCDWWESERGLDRVAHGVANRVDRIRCIGNGQVPAVAALAWEILTAPDTSGEKGES